MQDSSNSQGSARPEPPTYKAKGSVLRSVNAVLDELAPERALTRGERLPAVVEQHRSPTGCILQAADHALSVSWFGDGSKGAPLGELHIILWRGVVARRGATRHTKGATILSEHVLLPIEPPEDGYVWRAADGTRYDTVGLVALCLSLMRQVAAPTP
jgi:hypothetical protein